MYTLRDGQHATSYCGELLDDNWLLEGERGQVSDIQNIDQALSVPYHDITCGSVLHDNKVHAAGVGYVKHKICM